MKVLVPLDGSEVSMQSMEQGLAMLKPCKPEVILLCVCAEGFDNVDDDRRAIFEDDPHDEIFASETEAQAMLDKAVARCKEVGVKAKTLIDKGSVPTTILQHASQCDILLMHHLTKESIREKLRMSQTETIVRGADCAVLLV